MKNPDGSSFQGTPEQFVQQQSSWFKKAFGDSKLIDDFGSPQIIYHGTNKPLVGDQFNLNYFGKTDSGWLGKGIYTHPRKKVAEGYAYPSNFVETKYGGWKTIDYKPGEAEKLYPQSRVYSLYGNATNPLKVSKSDKRLIQKDFGRSNDDGFNEYDAVIDNTFSGEIMFRNPIQLKSAIGNVGFFDMTNPNIFKGLVPVVTATGAAAAGANQLNQEAPQKRYGGRIKHQLSGNIPDPTPNTKQVVSDYENEILNRTWNKYYGRQPVNTVRFYKEGFLPFESEYYTLTDNQKALLAKHNNLDKVKSWYEKYPEYMNMDRNNNIYGFANIMYNDKEIEETLNKYNQEQFDFDNSVKNNREWYKNWYDKRAQLPQFKEIATSRSSLSDKDIKSVLSDPVNMIFQYDKYDHPEGLPFPKIERMYADGFASRKNNTAFYNVKTAPSTKYIDSKNKLQNSIVTHEESHLRDFIHPQKNTVDKLDINTVNWGKDNSDPLTKILTKEHIDKATRKIGSPMFTNYLLQPTEIRARLNVWRQKNNIDPLKKYTKEEIKSIIDEDLKKGRGGLDWNIKQLYDVLNNDPEILNYLNNSYVSNKNNIPANTAKYGGRVRYQLGGEDPTPSFKQISETVSNYENEILNKNLNKYGRQPIKPIHVYKPGVIPPGSEFSQLTDDQKELLKRGNNLDKVKTWYEKYHTEMNPNKGYLGFKDALNEMDHFFDIKKILENQDKEKDNFDKAFQNNKEWYKNWYDKRRQLSNFKDVADFRYNMVDDEFNPNLSDKINMGLNQWEDENYGDLPFPKHHYIPRGYNAYYDMKGNTWYDINGIIDRNFTDKDGKLQNGLITHEESHLRDHLYPQEGTNFWFDDMDKDWRKPGGKWDPIELIISKEDIENTLNDYKKGKEGSFNPRYHYQPTEVRARLNVWRQRNNIDPLMNYSPEEIQNIMDEDLKNKDLDHNIKELYQLLKNNPKYLKFINDSYVSNDNNIPVNMAKEGGTLKYQLGGEASSPEVDNESNGLSYGLSRNSNTDKFNDIANYYFNKNRFEIVPINPMKKGAVENDAQEFLTKMINSPLFEKRYNTMRQKTATPEEVNAYKQSMLNNMDKVQYWPIGYESNTKPWMPDEPDNDNALGYYIKDFYPTHDEYEIPNLSTDFRKEWDKYHTIFRKDNSPTTTLHELSHASTISDSIPSRVRIPYSIKPEKAEYVKKYTGPDYQRPTEHKAYLDELRKYLYDKKVYDPTQKEFDETDYDNLINEYEKFKKELEKDPNNLELQYLESVFEKNILPYDKQNTIKLFNSYVNNNKNNTPMNIAKYGGRLKYK